MKDITLKTEEALIACDVSDEALEVASGAAREQANFTLGSCTNLSECPDPLSPSRSGQSVGDENKGLGKIG